MRFSILAIVAIAIAIAVIVSPLVTVQVHQQPSRLRRSLQQETAQISDDCKSKRNLNGFDVVLLMGQSNMSGTGKGYDPTLDGVQGTRIKQWSQANTIVPAKAHLQHADWLGTKDFKVGMGTSFARQYLKGTALVRYGAKGSYVEKRVSGEIACTNSAFGRDPIRKVPKTCEVFAASPSPWKMCSSENGVCSLPPTVTVRYGARGSYVEKRVSGAIACTNSAFGRDPIPRVAKTCAVFVASSSSWQMCSGENGVCSVTIPKVTVRYGAYGSYTQKRVSGAIACTNRAFGRDPIRFVPKTCEVFVALPTSSSSSPSSWNTCSNEDGVCSFTGTELPLNRKVLLVPTAYGGTGLVNGPWSPGGRLFEGAMTRVKAALDSGNGDNNCMAAVLWHQGESDANAGRTRSQYERALHTMLVTMRSRDQRLAKVPFVLGEFAYAWIAATGTRTNQVLAALRDTPNREPYTALAPAEGLTTNPNPDIIHFDAVGMREYGKRYVEALDAALKNVN